MRSSSSSEYNSFSMRVAGQSSHTSSSTIGLKATVNVMGGLTLRAHCGAHIASSADGATVIGSNTENKGVTVMGATRVERIECK